MVWCWCWCVAPSRLCTYLLTLGLGKVQGVGRDGDDQDDGGVSVRRQNAGIFKPPNAQWAHIITGRWTGGPVAGGGMAADMGVQREGVFFVA